jgi:TRAP transporter TAXI family solute receptor
VVCASFLLSALLFGAAAQSETESRFFRIGTAATGGSFFEIGGVVASAISGPVDASACSAGASCGVPGLVAVAQATQGSIENLRLVDGGLIESALAQADLASMAYAGNGALGEGTQMRRLRAIASLFPEALHVVVRGDSQIREIADLAGKIVSFGEAGSGSAVNARVLLAAAGFGEAGVIPKYHRLSQAAEELQAGTIDALIVAGGLPIPAIAELAKSVPLRLVPIAGSVANKLGEQVGVYQPMSIPAGSYRNMPEDTPSVGFYALWLTYADLDPKLVYEIARAAWSKKAVKLYTALAPIGNDIRIENALQGISVPLHPGAERFYHESGMNTDGLPFAGMAKEGSGK